MKATVIHKWLSILLLISVTLPILVGCGTKDIDKRKFVIAIGIDKNEDDEKPYKVTLKIPIPTNNKASQTAQFILLTQASETISEAIHLLTSHVDKNLEFSHTKFLVIGEKIVDQDLRVVMDIFLRRRDFQQTAWVTVARPNAEAIMKAMSSSDISDINLMLNRFSSIGTESSYIVSIFLFDFRRQLTESGINPVLPIIETNEKNEIIVNKAMVISNDNKGLELSSEYTEDYNALTGRLKNVTVKAKVVNEEHIFTVMLDNIKVKYKLPATVNDNPIVRMQIDVKGVVEESTHPMMNEDVNLYNKLTSQVIEDRVKSFLTFIQKNEVDPLGFGLRYEATHWHHPDLADEWKEIYAEIDFEVNANVLINSLGFIQ